MLSEPIGELFAYAPESAWEKYLQEKYWSRFLHSIDLSELSSYEYSTLNESGHIRLMRLHPAIHSGSTLQCSLITVKLGSTPFEALSYVWGSTEQLRPLVCDHALTHITENLENALRRLRKKRTERVLWVDAICINQNNIKEKEQQIPLMKDIYSGSSRTLVWLGEAEAYEDTGVSIMALFYSMRMECWVLRATSFLFSLLMGEWGQTMMQRPGKHDVTGHEQVRRLLESDWFRRTWTLQELLLNKRSEFVCGRHSVPARAFALHTQHLIRLYSLSTCYEPKWRFRAQGQILLRHLLQDHKSAKKEEDFVQLMMVIKSAETTDPKDKVIGIQAVLERMGLVLAHLSYDMTKKNLYFMLTRMWMLHWKSLHILHLGRSATRVESLPSWYVDWNDTEQQNNEVICDHYTRSVYLRCADPSDITISATNHSEIESHIFRKDGELALRGLHLGVVSQHVVPSGVIYRNICRDTRNTEDEEQLGWWACTARTVIKWAVFLDSCYAGKYTELLHDLASILNIGPSTLIFKHGDQDCKDLRKILNFGRSTQVVDSALLELLTQSGLLATQVWRALMLRVDSETLFFTADGRLGISSAKDVKNGDVAMLVAGSDFPLLIRPHTSQVGSYTYVGPTVLSTAASDKRRKTNEVLDPSFLSRHKHLRPKLRRHGGQKGKFRNHWPVEFCEHGVVSSTMYGHEWNAEATHEITVV